jgi:hypothetical protein
MASSTVDGLVVFGSASGRTTELAALSERVARPTILRPLSHSRAPEVLPLPAA